MRIPFRFHDFSDVLLVLESISSATTPDNTLETKAAAVSSKTTIKLSKTEIPPNSIPANNVGMTATIG